MKFVFFSVSENRENGLGDKGADGGNASPPENFWARTALSRDFSDAKNNVTTCSDSIYVTQQLSKTTA